jgi:hypothetical protein
MKQEWAIRRQTVQQSDGQRRWDMTYQCLLKWAQAAIQEASPMQTSQEVQHASSNLCSSLDPAAGTDADH